MRTQIFKRLFYIAVLMFSSMLLIAPIIKNETQNNNDNNANIEQQSETTYSVDDQNVDYNVYEDLYISKTGSTSITISYFWTPDDANLGTRPNFKITDASGKVIYDWTEVSKEMTGDTPYQTGIEHVFTVSNLEPATSYILYMSNEKAITNYTERIDFKTNPPIIDFKLSRVGVDDILAEFYWVPGQVVGTHVYLWYGSGEHPDENKKPYSNTNVSDGVDYTGSGVIPMYTWIDLSQPNDWYEVLTPNALNSVLLEDFYLDSKYKIILSYDNTTPDAEIKPTSFEGLKFTSDGYMIIDSNEVSNWSFFYLSIVVIFSISMIIFIYMKIKAK